MKFRIVTQLLENSNEYIDVDIYSINCKLQYNAKKNNNKDIIEVASNNIRYIFVFESEYASLNDKVQIQKNKYLWKDGIIIRKKGNFAIIETENQEEIITSIKDLRYYEVIEKNLVEYMFDYTSNYTKDNCINKDRVYRLLSNYKLIKDVFILYVSEHYIKVVLDVNKFNSRNLLESNKNIFEILNDARICLEKNINKVSQTIEFINNKETEYIN